MTQPISPSTITELCELRASAKAAAEMFSEAIAEQAEQHGLKKGALRRYICAREADKVADLDAESDDLIRLMREDGAV